jgi:hypothetical protein
MGPERTKYGVHDHMANRICRAVARPAPALMSGSALYSDVVFQLHKKTLLGGTCEAA